MDNPPYDKPNMDVSFERVPYKDPNLIQGGFTART